MTNCCFLHPLHKVPLPIFRKMSGVEKKSKAKARRDRQMNVVKRMGENQQAEEGWVSNPRRIPRHERRELNRQAAAAGIALVPLPIGNQPSAHAKAYALRPVGVRPSLRATTTFTTTTTTSIFSTTTSFPLLPPPPPLGIVPRAPAPWQRQAVSVAPLASWSFAADAHRTAYGVWTNSDGKSWHGVKDPEI